MRGQMLTASSKTERIVNRKFTETSCKAKIADIIKVYEPKKKRKENKEIIRFVFSFLFQSNHGLARHKVKVI